MRRPMYNMLTLLFCVANSPDALIFKCGTKRGRNPLKTLGGAGKNAAKRHTPLEPCSPPHGASGLDRARCTPRQNGLASGSEQRVAIEMRLAMVGERVERPLDRGLVADSGRRSKRREPRRALAVVGEQPMHIGSGDEAT
jgi:hypothetical protein